MLFPETANRKDLTERITRLEMQVEALKKRLGLASTGTNPLTQGVSLYAELAGVNQTTLRRRLLKGMPLEEAIAEAREIRERTQSFAELKSLAERAGVNYWTARKYWRKGMTPVDALVAAIAVRRSPNTRWTPGVVHATREAGVVYATVQKYLKKGLSLEEAVAHAKAVQKPVAAKLQHPEE